MRRAAALTLLSLAAGCATPQQRVSFDQAFAARAEPPPPPMVVRTARGVTARSLEAALPQFERAERDTRALARPGVPMPDAQVDHWRALISQVQGLLVLPPGETPIETVHAVAGAIEREIDADARIYGDFPKPLAETLMERQGDLAIRAQLLAQLTVPTPPSRVKLRWPISPVTITSLFGRRMHPLLRVVREHDGVDLAAAPGQTVLAAAGGVVERAGEDGGYGLLVEVLHPNGLITRYAHLDQLLVKKGQRVRAGEGIGLAGETGLATGVHLHFEVWRKGRPIDPLVALGAPKLGKPLVRTGRLVSTLTPPDHRG